MNVIKQLFRGIGEYKALVEARKEMIKYEQRRPLLATGLSEGARYALCACLCEDFAADTGKPALIICGDEKEAVKIGAALSELGLRCLSYPERDFSFRNIACSHEY